MRIVEATKIVAGNVIVEGGRNRYEVDFVDDANGDVLVDAYDRVCGQLQALRYLESDLVSLEW